MNFICPKCKNSGMFRDDQGEPILCDCVKKKRLLSLYAEIGLPPKFINVDLAQYSIKQDAYGNDLDKRSENQKRIAKNIIQEFINSLPAMLMGDAFSTKIEKNNKEYLINSFTLLLRGERESGKSMLAACIAKEALKYSIKANCLEWSEIINACFDYYSDSSAKNDIKIQRYGKIVGIIENSNLLIIDNLDKAYESNNSEDKLTANVRRQIDAMFSSRYKKPVPTVFTTNQTFKELDTEDKYGPVLLNILNDAIKIELPSLGKTNDFVSMKKVN